MPTTHKLNPTWPFWVNAAASAKTSRSLNDAVPVSYAASEIASYGSLDGPQLLYHFEYRPVSGYLNLYGIHPFSSRFALQAGEFSLISQYDPRLEVSPSLPVFLFPQGAGPFGPDRYGPFSPSGFVYGVRGTASLSGGNAMPYSDGWKVSATVPFSKEVPCTGQPDFDSSPAGIFLEAYHRTGMNSYGVDVYSGRDGRQYYGVTAQQSLGKFYLEGGAANANFAGFQTQMLSLGCSWIPTPDKAVAFRIDDQDGFIKYVPTLSYLIGGKASAVRLVAESQITHGVAPITTFSVAYKF